MFLEGNWLAATDSRGHIVRLDLRSGAISQNQIPGSTIAIDGSGRLVVVRDAELVLWTDDTLATLPIAGVLQVVINPAGIVLITRDRSVTVIRDDGTQHTYHLGANFRPSVALAAPLAVLPGFDTQVVVVDLLDGHMITFPAGVQGALIDVDGTSVIGYIANTGVVWKIPEVLSEPELRAAIDRATNARLVDQTARLVFD
jgi:hypothetical protein